MLQHEIQLVAMGVTESRFIIHYFFRGEKYLLQVPLEDTENTSQYQAIELAAKAEEEKINKREARNILHPVMQNALKGFVHF